ncbi:MAG: LysM peptidoglycan-binding domain-containing protein [Saprospiraceae bacterium]|nr:LysM peptidoglycan-binding domain-containing protein [Saprospiraceae bacterium]
MSYRSHLTKRFALALLTLGAARLLLPAQDFRQAYIEQFKDIAIQEMERAGVPASIKLAQGILESDFGRSDLAKRANNHFGIKCGANWDGREFFKEDDDYDANGRLIKSCFRVYRSPETSFIAHSEFLRDPAKEERYGFLFRLDPMDYQSWARGLKRAGYATAATYHERLINIIETYKLHQYDRLGKAPIVEVNVPGAPSSAFGYNNDVRYVLSTENESVSTVARRTEVSFTQLVRYNEHLTDGEQRLDEGTIIYLQPKRNAYRGRVVQHYVKEGETMFDISQAYGIKLTKLLNRNRMDKGMEPAPGQPVKLRGGKVKQRPLLRSEAPAPTPGRIEFEETPVMPLPPAKDTVTTPAPVTPERDPVIRPGVPVTVPEQLPVPIPEPTPEPTPAPVPPSPVLPEEPKSEPRPETPAPQQPVYHVVDRGDTLWNISQRYQTTVAAIRQLNGLSNDNIQLGQRLRVK